MTWRILRHTLRAPSEDLRLPAGFLPDAPTRAPACVGNLREAKIADTGGAGESLSCRGFKGGAAPPFARLGHQPAAACSW